MNCDVSRTIERIAFLPSSCLALLTKSVDELALFSPFLDHVSVIVGKIKIVVCIDRNAVLSNKLTRSPCLNEVPVLIENNDWMVATV